ncbi:hypothetical protein C4J81_02625 [Deltaproteobacteria bacterium Smac51]|nr:hypothetical protein C4J81_02625 [Deltaproteobacteria bacterium Smac51]
MARELIAFLNFEFRQNLVNIKSVSGETLTEVPRFVINWRDYQAVLASLGLKHDVQDRPLFRRYLSYLSGEDLYKDLVSFQEDLRHILAEVIHTGSVPAAVWKRIFKDTNGLPMFIEPDGEGDWTPESAAEMSFHYDFSADTYRLFVLAMVRGLILNRRIFSLTIDKRGKFDLPENFEPAVESGPEREAAAPALSEAEKRSALKMAVAEELPLALSKAVAEKLPVALAAAVADKLAPAVEEKLPAALSGKVEEKLPAALNAAVIEKLPGALAESAAEKLPVVMEALVKEQLPEALSAAVDEKLGEALSDAVTLNLPEALNRAVADRLPAALSEAVEMALPDALAEAAAHRVSDEDVSRAMMAEPSQALAAAVAAELPGALSAAVEAALPEALDARVAELLPEALKTAVDDRLTAELPMAVTERLPEELARAVEAGLPEKLSLAVEAQLPDSLKAAIEDKAPAALALAVSEKLPEEMALAISAHLPDKLAESVAEHLPGELAKAVEAGLPEKLAAAVQSALPEALEAAVRQELESRIVHQHSEGPVEEITPLEDELLTIVAPDEADVSEPPSLMEDDEGTLVELVDEDSEEEDEPWIEPFPSISLPSSGPSFSISVPNLRLIDADSSISIPSPPRPMVASEDFSALPGVPDGFQEDSDTIVNEAGDSVFEAEISAPEETASGFTFVAAPIEGADDDYILPAEPGPIVERIAAAVFDDEAVKPAATEADFIFLSEPEDEPEDIEPEEIQTQWPQSEHLADLPPASDEQTAEVNKPELDGGSFSIMGPDEVHILAGPAGEVPDIDPMEYADSFHENMVEEGVALLNVSGPALVEPEDEDIASPAVFESGPTLEDEGYIFLPAQAASGIFDESGVAGGFESVAHFEDDLIDQPGLRDEEQGAPEPVTATGDFYLDQPPAEPDQDDDEPLILCERVDTDDELPAGPEPEDIAPPAESSEESSDESVELSQKELPLVAAEVENASPAGEPAEAETSEPEAADDDGWLPFLKVPSKKKTKKVPLEQRLATLDHRKKRRSDDDNQDKFDF